METYIEEFVEDFTQDDELIPIDIVIDILGLTYNQVKKSYKIVKIEVEYQEND